MEYYETLEEAVAEAVTNLSEYPALQAFISKRNQEGPYEPQYTFGHSPQKPFTSKDMDRFINLENVGYPVAIFAILK